jgi:hypothetical protein
MHRTTLQKVLISLLIPFFSFQQKLAAQTVLTDTGINPTTGDVYTLHSGNYTSPGNSGAGQAWNLTAITLTSTASYTVNPLVQAPSSAQFSATANTQMNNGSIYNFFHASAGALRNAGYLAVSTVAIVYSDAEDQLHYPFSFNDNFSDNFSATFTLSNIAFTRSGSTSVSYDGWGSLQLPTRGFTEVARIHLVQNYSDVSAFNTTTYTNDQYLWFVNGHHQALAGVFSTTVNGSPASQGGFYSADTSLAIGLPVVRQGSFRFMAFPNPASSTIHFSLEDVLVIQQIDLFDVTGTLVLDWKADPALFTGRCITMHLNNLAGGIYMAKVTSHNGWIVWQKISLIR